MKKLDTLLAPGLLRASIESDRLKTLVSRCMPEAAVDQILHARLTEKSLKLVVGNAAWAARLRFQSRDIIHALALGDLTIEQITVHVLPANARRPLLRKSTRKRPTARPDTVSGIAQVANEIDRQATLDTHGSASDQTSAEDPLGKALRQLAKNLESIQ